MKIKANGIQFNCRAEGKEGAPWIVFSNSLATRLAQWDAQVAAFRDRFQILRYDQRGHGETDAPNGAYTFDQLTDDAVALLDAFTIDRATFAGISMGAVTGLRIASR